MATNEPSPVPAGAIQIEDDEPQTPTQAAAVVPPTPAPVAAAPVVPAEDAELDLSDPELTKDQQRVTAILAELGRKRQEVKDLKPKAAEVEAIRQQWQQAQPYIDFLKANPQLLQPRQEAQPTPVTPTPQDDPDAVEAAQLMDFYTADGKPDAARGARWLALQERRAGKMVQQAVQPLHQNTNYQRAQANYAAIVNMRGEDGQPVVDRGTLDVLWRQTMASPQGLETLATEQGAAATAAAAVGFPLLFGKRKVTAPPSAPIHTEPSGGQAPRPRVSMTAQSQRIAQERGWDAEKYAKLTKDFVPGRGTQLED